VDEGKTGLLPAIGDAKAFAASVAQMLDDSEKREAMGKAAMEWVKGRHDMAAVRDLVSQALEALRVPA
jgi:glycosyltransferase involved in cell wall biosynthesis